MKYFEKSPAVGLFVCDLCAIHYKSARIKLSLHRVTHDGLTHPGVKTNIDNSAGVSKQTQDLGVKEAALSGFSR